MQLNNADEESLWVTLHDGILESLTSDRLARSLTLVVDVPYIWEFHALSEESRFHLMLSGVRNTTALDFAPWPGNLEISQELAWEEQERLRKELYNRGRLQSTEWDSLVPKLNNAANYDISNASLDRGKGELIVLRLSLMNQAVHDYPQLLIMAENLRFWLHPADRELSFAEFTAMGGQYWEDFARGTHSTSHN